MKTIDRQACENLAFMWCCRWHPRPRRWAEAHWMEFLDELETETGRMWLRLIKRDRERKQREKQRD